MDQFVSVFLFILITVLAVLALRNCFVAIRDLVQRAKSKKKGVPEYHDTKKGSEAPKK